MEEAAEERTKVRIKTNNDKTQKYLKVWSENDKYYGIQKIRGEQVKTLINQENIERVQIKDDFYSVGSIVLVLAIVGYAIVESLWNEY